MLVNHVNAAKVEIKCIKIPAEEGMMKKKQKECRKGFQLT